MRRENVIVFDPLNPAPEYEYIDTQEDFDRVAHGEGTKPCVFSESFLAIDGSSWKVFVDSYLYYRAARGWRISLPHDFLDRRRLSDFSSETATYEHSTCRLTDPRFSFVIPFRDRDHTLPAVLHHLSHLKCEAGFEVILVNDGSREPVSEEVRHGLDLLKCDWTIVSLPPSQFFRAGFARNIGAAQARGEVLAFIDSDILLRPDFLSDLDRQLELGDLIQAKRWQLWRGASGLELPERLEEPNAFWFDFHSSPVDWMALAKPWRYASTYCLALRRTDFERLGGFRLWYSKYGFEDTDLGLRAVGLGLKLKRSNSDVFHLSPLTRQEAFNHPARRRREGAMRESARKYFILNDAVDSLDWLTHMMA